MTLIKPAFAANVPLSQYYGFGNIPSVGGVISALIAPIFQIAALLILFYMFFAGWKYLTSGGNKEELAKARGMIVHAIIGFLLLIFLFVFIAIIPNMLGYNVNIISGQ